jgi:acetyl-CoA carboxylase carboxyl transferase subunit alpha
MLEHSVYSVISPEGAASILWRDSARATDAATNLKITAQDLHRLGVIDHIIPEPVGGAHRDPVVAVQSVEAAISDALQGFAGMDGDALRRHRREKFLAIGRTIGG